MADFDIRTLTHFNPPSYRCIRCKALLRGWTLVYDKSVKAWRCDECSVPYRAESGTWADVKDHFKYERHLIDFPDVIAHAQALARLALELETPSEWSRTPPMAVLLDVLLAAKSFIHFVSWGLDPYIVGALRLASRRVPVNGIASNVSNNIRNELTEFTSEVPNLNVRCVAANTSWAAPHQKLLIVDGLLAFEGSANLTSNSWRKTAEGTDRVEAVTDIGKVMDLNNRYFAKSWKRLDSRSEEPVVIPDVPF